MNSANYAAKAYLDLRMPCRDGVELSTNVYLPSRGGPFPVMLVRTPYNAAANDGALEWTARGYAFVKQDTRGCFLSGGEYVPWFHEKADGEDTLAWIAAQPWCNGSIAMYGGSYLGATQIAAVESGNPALRCITPALIGAEFYHAHYWGGVLRLGRLSRWALKAAPEIDQSSLEAKLPVIEADLFARGREVAYWRDILAHPRLDDYWKPHSFSHHVASIGAPAFIRTGWFDLFVCDAFDLFNGLRQRAGEAARRHSRILVGPWPHNINQRVTGEEDFGAVGAVDDLYEQEVAFIEHFTNPKPGCESGKGYDMDAAPLRLFIMGANQWRDEYEWPLARTVWTKMFLSSGGHANTAAGDGGLGAAPSGPADQFDYDPARPVPTRGGAWDFENIGPHDQSEIEERPDVLVYSSEPLAGEVEVTGPVTLVLYASSSAKDTDFTAKLVDVRADGRPMSVTDGIVRARYRNEKASGEEFLTPGEVYAFTIRLNPTAYVFKKGHRLRLEVSSSNFPTFARNLNTGNALERDCEIQVARQTIMHSEEYPSHLLLPVIGAS